MIYPTLSTLRNPSGLPDNHPMPYGLGEYSLEYFLAAGFKLSYDRAMDSVPGLSRSDIHWLRRGLMEVVRVAWDEIRAMPAGGFEYGGDLVCEVIYSPECDARADWRFIGRRGAAGALEFALIIDGEDSGGMSECIYLMADALTDMNMDEFEDVLAMAADDLAPFRRNALPELEPEIHDE